MSISRPFQSALEARLREKSPLIQVLVGPRQVGKTTAVRRIFDQKGIYFSADSPVPLPTSEIENLWHQANQSPDPLLAIDEIQKIPGWAETVKKLWDGRSKTMKLVLLGSAALAIERDLKETLAGRFELIRVEHWNLSEAQEAFQCSFEQFLEFGCYPGAMPFVHDHERWGAYIRDSIVEPAIGRDILQLHPVQNPALLRQIFSVCVGHPSQIVSLNKLQGMLQDRGAMATLQHYLELLGFGFLVSGVQKFAVNTIRTRSSPPKLIVHDNALIRAFERPVSRSPDPKRLGHYLENAIGARLIEAGWETYYWKEKTLEVDFVALGPGGEKLAIEVKITPPRQEELKGLFHFCRHHPEFKACLISPLPTSIEGVEWIDAARVLSLSRQNPTLSLG